VAAWFRALDVPVIPKAVQGWHQGRWYPQAYTARQRALFSEFSRQAEGLSSASRWLPYRSGPAVDPLADREFLDGFPDFHGISCSAGSRFVSIGYDGRIFRCGQRTEIGNLYERRLELLPGVRSCDDEYCPYWCLRYSRFRDLSGSDWPRREAPGLVRQALVRIRGLRRELGNRVAAGVNRH